MGKKTLSCVLLAASLTLSSLSSALHAAECGLMFNLSGSLKCLSADGRPITLKPFTPLPAQASCQLEKDVQLTLTHYASLREYRISGPGALNLDCKQVTAPKSTLVRQVSASKQQQIKTVAATYLVQGAMTMRNPGVLKALNLEGENRLLQAPTNIRYAVPPDTAAVKFILKNEDGKELYTIISKQSPITLPANLIQAKQSYSWQLDSLEPDSSAPAQSISGKFSVIDDSRARKLRAERPTATANSSQWLLWISDAHNAGYTMDARTAVAELRTAMH